MGVVRERECVGEGKIYDDVIRYVQANVQAQMVDIARRTVNCRT